MSDVTGVRRLPRGAACGQTPPTINPRSAAQMVLHPFPRSRCDEKARGGRAAARLLLLRSARRLRRRAFAGRGSRRGPERLHRSDAADARGAGRRRPLAAARGPAGLRGRAARPGRERRRRRDRRRATAERIWDTTRLRASSQGDAPREREPEPLAPGEAERHPRALRGRRRHLPGARLRHLEPDADPRRRPAGSSSIPLTSRARPRAAALALARRHLGERRSSP